MINWQRDLNALLIVILSAVLLSAFGVQFIYHEEPCPLCLLQRLGMIGVASAAALNLWFGIKMSHYALALLSSIFGASVATRQFLLHVCPEFNTFGFQVLGLSLYTWSFITFVCVIIYISFLLFLFDPHDTSLPLSPINNWSKFATYLILAIAIANVITTFLQCGLGTCAESPCGPGGCAPNHGGKIE